MVVIVDTVVVDMVADETVSPQISFLKHHIGYAVDSRSLGFLSRESFAAIKHLVSRVRQLGISMEMISEDSFQHEIKIKCDIIQFTDKCK